ncbi:hypothetical protein ILYODFUR_033295 [Ilyodon furcidens]|uniref:Uncharacterized protein n=1 Tax=Ilyodon furcidens TaxID=33524 RepID=A0ABV0T2A6_9TELE
MVILFAIQKKVDLFQCYNVHYASCGSVHRTMTGLQLNSFWDLLSVVIQLRYVPMPLLQGNLLVRIMEESGILSLIDSHGNNIIKVPHSQQNTIFSFLQRRIERFQIVNGVLTGISLGVYEQN